MNDSDYKMDSREGYEKIYDEFADAIFRYCYLKVSDREKAKDIMQDTFIKVWRHFNNKNNKEIMNIRAFLYKTASNLIIDQYRKENGKKKMTSLNNMTDKGFDVASHDHKTVHDNAEINMAMNIVNQLDDKYKEVFIMRYVEDMSPKEIAKIIGRTENATSVRINTAVKKLRNLINQKE